MAYKHSPSRVIFQLREQLTSDKRKLGFFLGAGTSMAVGVPGVFALTEQVEKNIDERFKESFKKIKAATDSNNIEYILNKLRTIREYIGDRTDVNLDGIKGKIEGQDLDVEICKTISQIIDESNTKKLTPHLIFSNWLFQNQASRYSPIELFTSNYDLLIERALEQKRIPYFDGFVGTIRPFLIPECIEAENVKNDQSSYVPYSWIRVWKIHGSINWILTTDENKKRRIVRCPTTELRTGDELMIYPSKQKYDESRRLPFLAFQDRLRKFLSNGETLLIVNGYSFSDDHLNEIIFQALRSNKRLAVTALMFGSKESGSDKRILEDRVLDFGKDHPNLTVLGPDRACVGGTIAEWDESEKEIMSSEYWDEKNKNFNMGDFNVFTEFLKMRFGLVGEIQNEKEEKTEFLTVKELTKADEN